MVRLILKLTDFTFQNNDRNTKRISPLGNTREYQEIKMLSLFLGISVELKSLELVRELLKCPKVDPNIIDTRSQRYIYDLAVESLQYPICIELESAFSRNNKDRYACKLAVKKNFHDLHEYTVEMVIQHQLRSKFFTFRNDPRGSFETFCDRSVKLPFLPAHQNWNVVKEEGLMDSTEGWTYGYLVNERDEPLAVNYSGGKVVIGGPLFSFIDNYRYRLMARVQQNSTDKSNEFK